MNRRQAIHTLFTAPLLLSATRAFALDLADVTKLKRGEFIWRPELSPRGPVVVLVSLPHQIVHVFRNGLAIAASTCSSGAKGHETPTGVFTILQKREEHYSSTYNNAPMPNMQRLTWRGMFGSRGVVVGARIMLLALLGFLNTPVEFHVLWLRWSKSKRRWRVHCGRRERFDAEETPRPQQYRAVKARAAI